MKNTLKIASALIIALSFGFEASANKKAGKGKPVVGQKAEKKAKDAKAAVKKATSNKNLSKGAQKVEQVVNSLSRGRNNVLASKVSSLIQNPGKHGLSKAQANSLASSLAGKSISTRAELAAALKESGRDPKEVLECK